MERRNSHTFVERLLNIFPPPQYLKMHSAGIDISERDVRFIELVDVDHTSVVATYGVKQISENTLARGEVVDVEKLTALLSEIADTHDFSFVRASLPEQRAYIFRTTVPDARDHDEVRTILEFQLEEHVPISPDEAIFDYTVIKEHTSVGHTDISVTVFPKEVIEKYLAAFSRAGLTPLSFETEPQAIARSVVTRGDQGTHLLLNIGARRIGVFIVTNRAVSFTSSIDIAGEQLMQDDTQEESVENSIRKLAGEVERHQNYWDSQRNEKEEEAPDVESVMLAGAYAGVPGLVEHLQARLSVPVSRANVWENVLSFEEAIPPIHRDDSYGYATAIGLALRENN